jgi:hypothetical protein
MEFGEFLVKGGEAGGVIDAAIAEKVDKDEGRSRPTAWSLVVIPEPKHVLRCDHPPKVSHRQSGAWTYGGLTGIP